MASKRRDDAMIAAQRSNDPPRHFFHASGDDDDVTHCILHSDCRWSRNQSPRSHGAGLVSGLQASPWSGPAIPHTHGGSMQLLDGAAAICARGGHLEKRTPSSQNFTI